MFDPSWRAAYPTPGDLAVHLDPRTLQTPALDLIDEALVWAASTPDSRLIICMPPQEGKSQRASRRFPLWMLHRNPETRIAIVGYESNIARRWGRAIRDDIAQHGKGLHLKVRDDLAAQHEWQLEDHEGGVYTAGIGGALTGRPVDCVSADTYIVTDHGTITAAEAYSLGATRILAYDHATGRAIWRDVEAARRIPSRRFVTVLTAAGRSLACTPDHRVHTGRGYVPAGSLRVGDSLVVLVATPAVPVREPACGAEDGRSQGDPPRSRPLLLSGVHGGHVLRSQQNAVLRLRATDPAEPSINVFGRMRQSAKAACDAMVSAVRCGVPSQIVANDLLHPDVRQRRTLNPDDRQGQLTLQDRHKLRPMVQADASSHPGARRAPMSDVLRKPNPDLLAARPHSEPLSAGDSPHQRGRDEQPSGEPDHPLHYMPFGAPQVEADTVATVRDGGSETVDVYDFQVAGARNFFADGVLVHNCLIIDDPIKDRADADSEVIRKNVIDWWTDTGSTRLAPGAPVILIQTRWHPDDLAGWLLKQEDAELWRLVSIPAQAECLDPADDPLGRELGEFMDSARRRTKAQWEAIKRRSPLRTWAALYQQRPTPAEGTIWQESWISNFRGTTGEAMHKWVRVLVGVDPAATSKLSSDETGIVVTAMDSDGIAWVVDDRSLRGTPTEWGVAVWHAVFDWGGTGIVVESNQGGDMVLTVLQTSWATAVASYQRLHPGWRAPLAPPVTKVHANRSKRIRAESVSALYETGRVRHAADGTPRLAALEDQMTAWTGVGDSPDRIDALVHALTALFLPEHADAGVGAGRQQQQSRRRAAGRR